MRNIYFITGYVKDREVPILIKIFKNSRTGDSIQPAPPLDRIILNGYKYMNKITDEVYKIFNG